LLSPGGCSCVPVDFSPLYRSAVGFDRLAGLLEAAAKAESAGGYPPYNIESVGDQAYRVEIAVAGFKPEELDVQVKENLLTVVGQEGRQRRWQAVPAPRPRRAELRAPLPAGDYVVVTDAQLADGLLTIALERPAAEALKARRIQIGTTPATTAYPGRSEPPNRPRLAIDETVKGGASDRAAPFVCRGLSRQLS
jgi:molecular chaperone IbpA